MQSFDIKYLSRPDIDAEKWNNCIALSHNGLCYAHTDFLDYMAPGWHALIQGNYEAVMPLTWRKKFGIRYLFQPAFCQQLGVFKKTEEDSSDLFLQNVPDSFLYWDIHLNSHNTAEGYDKRRRKNYLLPLVNYNDVQKGYSRNARRNISAANQSGIQIINDIPVHEVFRLHHERFGYLKGVRREDYISFAKLMEKWKNTGKVFTIAAANRQDELLASSMYILFGSRIVFVMNGNLEKSLETGATHLLKDTVIQKFAGRGLTMDFEGSDNPAFARFYEQFGASHIEYYTALTNNKLPWPVRWLK